MLSAAVCLLFVVSFNSADAKILLPNAVGFYSQWGGLYTDVDEYPNNDGDATYNYVSTENALQSYNFQDSSDSGTIDGVRVIFYAKVNGADLEYIRPFLRINGSDYFGDNCATINNSSYTQCSYYWSLNPYNTSGWSVSDLTNLEAGVKTIANGTWDNSEHRVSQIYIDVDFKVTTKKTKYFVVQKLVETYGATNDAFTFSIADSLNSVQSAFIEIRGIATPVASVNLGVKVDDSASTPGVYDKTYTINATGRPTLFKINHDVTDYFKSFVTGGGSYERYIHLNSNNNIYLLNARLVLTYTWIIPPSAAGAYRAKTEVISSIFDTTGSTDGPSYNSVMWKGNLNSGKVKIQIATSDSDTGPWNSSDYKGSDCSSNSWYEINADTPTEIKCPSNHDNKRYFRYKIQLCSSNDCTTSGGGHPEVNDVIISWSP